VVGILLLMTIVRPAQEQFDWVALDVIILVLAAAAAIARVVSLLRDTERSMTRACRLPNNLAMQVLTFRRAFQ
jgi:hypothetical protein